MDKKSLKCVLRSYELKPHLEKRLLGIAARRIQELGLSDFDEQYRYIDGLVGKFMRDWRERRNVREGANQSVESILDINDGNTEDEVVIATTIGEDLKRELDEREYAIFSSLVMISDTRCLLEQLSAIEISRLKEKIKEVFGENSREERLISLGVPIRHFDEDTLRIQFGNRRFKGNPLAYFQSYPERYSGLTRHQLGLQDHGLWNSLRRSGQLTLAIPGIAPHPKTLSQSQIEEVVAAFQQCGGNAQKAARHSTYSAFTFLKYWERNGLIKPERSSSDDDLPKEEVERINASFQEFCGVASKAARHLGHAIQTINRYWKKYELKDETNAHAYNSHTKEEVDRVVTLHEYYGGFVGDAARQEKRKRETFEKYWSAAGLIVIKRRAPVIRGKELFSQFRLERIVNSVMLGRISETEARKTLKNKVVWKNGQFLPVWAYEVTRRANQEVLKMEILYNHFEPMMYRAQKAA